MGVQRVDHDRRYRFAFGARRQALIEQCNELLAEVDAIDRDLAALAVRRRELVTTLRRLRRSFVRVDRHARARQPVPDGSVRLPPSEPGCEVLWGRRLRAACVAILRRTGPLALPELHALLHHHGFRMYADRSVKALADAMAYECRKGRLLRVERGVYGPIGSAAPDDETPLSGSCRFVDHLPPDLAPRAA